MTNFYCWRPRIRVHWRRGGWKQCLTFLELRWIYSMKSVSDLIWKNVARPKTANSFWPANFFLSATDTPATETQVWTLSQIWIGKTLLDQKLQIVSDQQTFSFSHWNTYFVWKILSSEIFNLCWMNLETIFWTKERCTLPL